MTTKFVPIEELVDLQLRVEEAEAERDDLDVMLELIRTRELEAIARWKAEDVDRYLKQPDYGELLDWLKAENEKAERERDGAWMALKAVKSCPKFDCDDCRELIEAVLKEVKG